MVAANNKQIALLKFEAAWKSLIDVFKLKPPIKTNKLVPFFSILVVKYKHNKKFFRAEEFSWNKSTINISSKTHEKKFPRENFSKVFFLQHCAKCLSKIK